MTKPLPKVTTFDGTENLEAPDGTMIAPQLKSLQQVDEQTVKRRASSELVPIKVNLQGGFLGTIIDGVASGIEGVAKWGFDKVAHAGQRMLNRLGFLQTQVEETRDGQLELNERQDLLSPLLDYGSFFIPMNQRQRGEKYLEFTQQLGPARGVELSGATIKLLDKGLWDIRMHVVADWVGPLSKSEVQVEMLVAQPGMAPYSKQIAAEKTSSRTTLTITSSVVVPDDGYRVSFLVRKSDSFRKFLTGPAWSRVSIQHISRSVEGATGAEESEADTSEGEGH